MIDYDKLREALELFEKIPGDNFKHIGLQYYVQLEDGRKDLFLRLYLEHWGDVNLYDFKFESTDELLTKLQELTEPKPRYSEGDYVFYLDLYDGVIKESFIYHCSRVNDKGNFAYKIRIPRMLEQVDFLALEESLYPTRQALIESQIAYWQGMRECEPDEYKIDTSGKVTVHKPLGTPFNYESSCCSVHAGSSDECEQDLTLCGIDKLRAYVDGKKECEHEPEMDIAIDSRPRFERAENPMCKHCGHLYIPECEHEHEHESDSYSYITNHTPREHSNKCKHCGEFYK